MARYNSTIWIVTLLVMVRLTNTMHGYDKKDSLEQKLLDRSKYGSSSATPTDNEMDLSKLKSLIDEYNYLQSLNRGSFASPQLQVTESDTIDKVNFNIFKTVNELDCNYMYDMLVFMKVMTPENYTNDKLFKEVDCACLNWAQQMLNARINSGFPSREFPYIFWVFYLYAKKMKTFAVRDAKKDLTDLHGYIDIHFQRQKEKCKMLWPKYNEYVSYAEELKSLDENSALKKTIETCTRLSAISESKDNFNLDLDSSLYINNVVEDTVVMNTLMKSFSGLGNGPYQLDILENSVVTAKNHTISLSKWIRSLKDVHDGFLRIVKTLMLRTWWTCLEKLKKIKHSQSAKQLQTILHEQHLNDFAWLFQLNENDDFMQLVRFEEDSALVRILTAVLPDFSIDDKMFDIWSLLDDYGTETPNLRIYSPEPEPDDCRMPVLLNIANGIGYKIVILSSIRESILCAEVLVEYLKNILTGVNFNILQSFDVFCGKFKSRELDNSNFMF